MFTFITLIFITNFNFQVALSHGGSATNTNHTTTVVKVVK